MEKMIDYKTIIAKVRLGVKKNATKIAKIVIFKDKYEDWLDMDDGTFGDNIDTAEGLE